MGEGRDGVAGLRPGATGGVHGSGQAFDTRFLLSSGLDELDTDADEPNESHTPSESARPKRTAQRLRETASLLSDGAQAP